MTKTKKREPVGWKFAKFLWTLDEDEQRKLIGRERAARFQRGRLVYGELLDLEFRHPLLKRMQEYA